MRNYSFSCFSSGLLVDPDHRQAGLPRVVIALLVHKMVPVGYLGVEKGEKHHKDYWNNLAVSFAPICFPLARKISLMEGQPTVQLLSSWTLA